MLERIVRGEVPAKHHIAFRDGSGALRHEECITRDGFEGPYTIAYHVQRPHTHRPAESPHGWPAPEALPPGPLRKRHFRTQSMTRRAGAPVDARTPLFFNDDVVLSVAFPDADDPVYVVNGDGDDCIFVHSGGGVVRSILGDLPFGPDDYVVIPKGIPHRIELTPGVAQHWFIVECRGGLHLPKQWRNEVGQLRMDAPYCHRDFRPVDFRGPLDESIRTVVVKRRDRFHAFELDHSILDVVGWDGSVYPFAFPILAFQPRAGLVHLPPTWHGTFATRGALICSFVPRMVDFHPEAIPCPYPHSSVDCDEVLFYSRGNFTSRRGVGPGSVSYHPMGVPHGPHPGAYEGSIGSRDTSELAVMLDTARPLEATPFVMPVEDPSYQRSFIA